MGARAVACACVLVALGAAAEARAWCRMTTSSAAPTPGSPCVTEGIPLEWKRRCIEYSIDARGSSDLTLDQVSDIVRTSFDAWLAVECPDGNPAFEIRESRDFSMCNIAEYNTDEGNVNTIAFVGDWDDREYDPAAYALTTVWHNTRTGEIYDADIEVNEMRGDYGICPPVDGCTDGTIDLQNVLTHEVGHFFGLGHTQPEHAFAVMYAVSPPGEVQKRILRTDDIEGFCSIYPAGVLPEACDFTPRHGLDLNCEDESCGCSTPGAARGERSSWLVLLTAAALLVLRRRTR